MTASRLQRFCRTFNALLLIAGWSGSTSSRRPQSGRGSRSPRRAARWPVGLDPRRQETPSPPSGSGNWGRTPRPARLRARAFEMDQDNRMLRRLAEAEHARARLLQIVVARQGALFPSRADTGTRHKPDRSSATDGPSDQASKPLGKRLALRQKRSSLPPVLKARQPTVGISGARLANVRRFGAANR
jgi:hypothetical protein